MKGLYSFIIVLLVNALITVRADYVFAPLPIVNEKQTILKAKPFATALSNLLGTPVSVRYYPSYDEILTAFTKGDIDFAELGPFNLLKLKKMTTHFAPLVFVPRIKNQTSYRCHLVAAMDNSFKFHELAQLKSPKIALTQPLSTCGWFSMDYFFQKNGLDLRQYNYQFIGSHDGVALSVLRLEHDFGAVAEFISRRYQPLGLEIIASTPDLPLFTLVANSSRISNKVQQKVQHYLLNLSEQETAQWGFGRYGFLPYRSELFKQFEKMVAKMRPIPEK